MRFNLSKSFFIFILIGIFFIFLHPVSVLACEPGDSCGTCTSRTCSDGTACAGGHTYCVWDEDGNYCGGCSEEHNNCSTSAGGICYVAPSPVPTVCTCALPPNPNCGTCSGGNETCNGTIPSGCSGAGSACTASRSCDVEDPLSCSTGSCTHPVTGAYDFADCTLPATCSGTRADGCNYCITPSGCSINGVRDGSETGIDCGGSVCPACSTSPGPPPGGVTPMPPPPTCTSSGRACISPSTVNVSVSPASGGTGSRTFSWTGNGTTCFNYAFFPSDSVTGCTSVVTGPGSSTGSGSSGTCSVSSSGTFTRYWQEWNGTNWSSLCSSSASYTVPTAPLCNDTPSCTGACTPAANTCSANNGTKGSCVYTTHANGTCKPDNAPDQACTQPNCSAGYTCSSSGTCILPPTVTLSASPTTITSGDSTILTWNISGYNATSCAASNSGTPTITAGSWSETMGNSDVIIGNHSRQISMSVTGANSTKTFSINCTNEAGPSSTVSVNVAVNLAPWIYCGGDCHSNTSINTPGGPD